MVDPLLCFLPLTQNIFWQPNLKIHDFSKLFIADAPMRKNIKKFSFTPPQRLIISHSIKNYWLLLLLYDLLLITFYMPTALKTHLHLPLLKPLVLFDFGQRL